MTDNKYPAEIIDLPSKGWFYPVGHPLASGKLEMYYMTARHEDILSSSNLIQKGVVIDKLLEALIVDKKIKYDDLLMGDKAGILIAARILGYGKMYTATIKCPQCEFANECAIDLSALGDLDIPFEDNQRGSNEFTFILPITNKSITYKLLTHKDEQAIQREVESMKKLNPQVPPAATTLLRALIVAVDGNRDLKVIREFVDGMPVRDSRALRDDYKKHNPDVDAKFHFKCTSCMYEQDLEVPMDYTFFWPKS